MSSRFKGKKKKAVERGSFGPRKAGCREAGSTLPVQRLRSWICFPGRTDAQLLLQGCSGLPPTLPVDIEDSQGPAPKGSTQRTMLAGSELTLALSMEAGGFKECYQGSHGLAGLHSLRTLYHSLSQHIGGHPQQSVSLVMCLAVSLNHIGKFLIVSPQNR